MIAPHLRSPAELVDHLVAGRVKGWWRYRGTLGPGEYQVEVDLTRFSAGTVVVRSHDLVNTSAWCDGWEVGRSLIGRMSGLAINHQLDPRLRDLLTCPSVTDQRRIRIAYAMEVRGWTYADIAAFLHAQRSTVRTLLRYGHVPRRQVAWSRTLAEVEALLPELVNMPAPAEIRRRKPVGPLSQRRREPAELHRARALALAAEAGLLVSWSPPDPTDLRAARVVQVVDAGQPGPRGEDLHTVRVPGLIGWVRGLADGVAMCSGTWSPGARGQIIALAHALA